MDVQVDVGRFIPMDQENFDNREKLLLYIIDRVGV